MAYPLSTLEDKLRVKINQVATNSNLVWQDADLHGFINDAIKHIVRVGSIELVQGSAYHRTNDSDGDHLTNAGSGYATKPSDYFRYVNARVDGKWVKKKIESSEIDYISDNQYSDADTYEKYICEISGSEFFILPTNFISCMLIYLREPADLSGSELSPLTNTGDTYMIDWAFALTLESKHYKPELAQAVFNRVNGLIK